VPWNSRTLAGIAVRAKANATYAAGYALTDDLLRWIKAQAPDTFRYRNGRLTVKKPR